MRMGRLQREYVNKEENAAKKLPFLESMMNEIRGEGVSLALELGCGPGYMAKAMREVYGLRVVGTDVDPAEIEFARRHSGGLEGLDFVEASATSLPFEDSSFDLVLSMMVLHHIPGWRDAAAEVVRVLRPGGYYLFHDLTYSWLLRLIVKPAFRSHAIYTIEEVSSFLEEKGMRTLYRSEPHKYLYDQFTEYNIVYEKVQPLSVP